MKRKRFDVFLSSLLAGLVLSGGLGSALAQTLGTDVTIQAPGPQGPLEGSYLAAGGDAPVVLILPGSGPFDRDGNGPGGVRPGSYRLLAHALAERGVSSVRVDKRGMFASKAAVADPNAVTIGDYAVDVQQWLTTIRERTGRSCVWVLGHSEGGLVALAAAQQGRGICGLVLVSAAGRPLGKVLREQLAASGMPDAILEQANQILGHLEAGERVEAAAIPAPLGPLFDPRVQGFLIDLLSHEPAKLAAAYQGPMLVVQGERDIQVSAADAAALREARPGARLMVVPGMTHILKHTDAEDRAGNIATYVDPDLPLAPGLAQGIGDFVLAHSPKG